MAEVRALLILISRWSCISTLSSRFEVFDTSVTNAMAFFQVFLTKDSMKGVSEIHRTINPGANFS